MDRPRLAVASLHDGGPPRFDETQDRISVIEELNSNLSMRAPGDTTRRSALGIAHRRQAEFVRYHGDVGYGQSCPSLRYVQEHADKGYWVVLQAKPCRRTDITAGVFALLDPTSDQVENLHSMAPITRRTQPRKVTYHS